MAELIVGLVLVVFVVVAIVWHERFVSWDADVVCPAARTPAEIRGGVCRRRDTGRVIGVAWGCHRPCLDPPEASVAAAPGAPRR